jgi:glutathione S-transferase
LEQVVLVIPSLWIFGTYVHELAGAGIGLFFLIARFIYRGSYINDPASRSLGFGLGSLALVVLMLGGLIGAVMQYLAA